MITDKNKIVQFLDYIIVPESSVGVHGITFRKEIGNNEELLKIAETIINEGLKVNKSGGQNIALTCSLFGDAESYNRDELLDYFCGPISVSNDDTYTSIVIAIPNVMVDAEGKEYFLGNFPKGLEKDNQVFATFPINRYILDKGFIPREFIVGYIYGNVNINPGEEEYSFKSNPHYIGLRSDEEKIAFFENIKSSLLKYGVREITPEILNEADFSELFQRLNLPKDEYLKQAKEYASKKYNVTLNRK